MSFNAQPQETAEKVAYGLGWLGSSAASPQFSPAFFEAGGSLRSTPATRNRLFHQPPQAPASGGPRAEKSRRLRLGVKRAKSIFLAIVLLSASTAIEAADRPEPLKLAVIAPVLEWDDVPEIERLTDWMQGHYNLKVTWIQPEHPPQTDDKEVQKAYHRNPPPVKGLEKALDADVVYTTITHVHLNKADTLTYFKLLMTKPIVAGKRAHHGLNISMDKNQELPDEILAGLGDNKVDKPQTRWAMAVFGCVMGGHHGGKVNIAEGQANHPIIQGLDELWQHRMTKRGYKYKQMAPDVKVLIESEGMPQIWVRDAQPDVDRRLIYVGYDPEDFDKHESLRRLMARAVVWAAGKDHRAHEDG